MQMRKLRKGGSQKTRAACIFEPPAPRRSKKIERNRKRRSSWRRVKKTAGQTNRVRPINNNQKCAN